MSRKSKHFERRSLIYLYVMVYLNTTETGEDATSSTRSEHGQLNHTTKIEEEKISGVLYGRSKFRNQKQQETRVESETSKYNHKDCGN